MFREREGYVRKSTLDSLGLKNAESFFRWSYGRHVSVLYVEKTLLKMLIELGTGREGLYHFLDVGSGGQVGFVFNAKEDQVRWQCGNISTY